MQFWAWGSLRGGRQINKASALCDSGSDDPLQPWAKGSSIPIDHGKSLLVLTERCTRPIDFQEEKNWRTLHLAGDFQREVGSIPTCRRWSNLSPPWHTCCNGLKYVSFGCFLASSKCPGWISEAQIRYGNESSIYSSHISSSKEEAQATWLSNAGSRKQKSSVRSSVLMQQSMEYFFTRSIVLGF